MRRGFTLVELTIVLVIIGLLIGGLLVAQSMISTAMVTAQAGQFQQFDVAVANFRSKYHYLPGDAPVFGGNGDGAIALESCYDAGGWSAANSYAGGISNVWFDLFPEKYAPGSTCPGVYPIVTGAGINVPSAKLGSNGSFIIAAGLSNNSIIVDTSNLRNFYAIMPAASIRTTITSGNAPGCCYQLIPSVQGQSAAKPVDTFALDRKIDDGKANSGIVISGLMNSAGGESGALDIAPFSTCSIGAVYQTNNSYECTPMVRIGGLSGDPQ